MRAWQVQRLGSPETALALVDVPVREPGPGEALVDVEAVGLNFPDLLLCAGAYQERPPLPFSPGYEAAGVVAAAGPGCRVAPGERVIVVPELPGGALQERLTVPEAQLYPVPGVDADVAAVLHVAYATAHAALHRRARLRAGETALVTGAAGGVGSAAVQLARAAGARVIGAATGAERAAGCGADVAVDLARDDLVEAVRESTGGRGVDVAVDVVGGELLSAVRRCMAFEGRLVVAGFTSGELPAVPANHVLLRNYGVLGLYLARYRREDPALLRRIHAELLALLADGAIAPRIADRLPFDAAPAALRRLAARGVAGRLVLLT